MDNSILKNLKEHSVYKVNVKCSENNLEHTAMLFVGFKTGAYCYVYNNTYDAPIPLKNIHSLQIIKFLTKTK